MFTGCGECKVMGNVHPQSVAETAMGIFLTRETYTHSQAKENTA